MKEKLLSVFFILLLIFSCTTHRDENVHITQYSWEVSDPVSLGISETKISEAFSKASQLDYLCSIIIIRQGKIAAEKYFNGYNKESYYKIKSVSKSFLSAVYGIATSQGVVSLNDNLTNIVNDYSSTIVDSRFLNITIDHLIKMKGGLDKDLNIYSAVVNSPNWLNTIFAMTLVNNPGVKFV